MKNKEKYDLRNIAYAIELDNGGYDFVVYYNSVEIHRDDFYGINSVGGAFTKWLEEEYDSKILTDKENAYLSAVIKPFREKVKSIEKVNFGEEYLEYLRICLENEHISFPYFREGTMYKGMEVNKRYALEELGL